MKRFFDKNEFKELKDNHVWDFANEILYELCENHPKHNQANEIIGKVWLIGRSYAASIERRTKTKRRNLGTNEFYPKVGETIKEFNNESNLDKQLSKLKKMTFGKESLRKTLTLHKELVDLLRKLTGKNNRSFVSKYLHFHSLNVPIYDSIAKTAINKIQVESKIKSKDIEKELTKAKVKCDKEYLKFCSKFLVLHNYICTKLPKEDITTRNIDKYLLRIKTKQTREK